MKYPGRHAIVLAASASLAWSSAARGRERSDPAPAVAPEPEEASSDDAAIEPEMAEVTVQVARSDAPQLEQSAEAVSVIETRSASRESADLGEVLARTRGVAVRRDGGLGSDARFSLNGLDGDQIRFFLDGVPLELAGFPFGVANVPVNLIQRVELYRGVVPVRLGADALGGAVNLVTEQSFETRLAASYQLGSFGVQRATLAGRWRHEPSGFVAGGSAFLDLAENDYPIDVEVPDELGRPQPARVRRFHDDYRAYGATLEAGWVDQPWAERLTLAAFASGYRKELQHNLVMTIPYGEVRYGEAVYGSTLRYAAELARSWRLELIVAYAHRDLAFTDTSEWVYDWHGERARRRPMPGEIEDASDQRQWQHDGFGRATLTWRLAPEQTLRLSLSPSYARRSGDERIQADPDARDPLNAKRKLFTLVSGLEHELTLPDRRLSNTAFVKGYVYRSATEEIEPGGLLRARDTGRRRLGFGDALRVQLLPWLSAKASYEYATRLPRPDEVFGDGALVHANLELVPEISHNANLGPRIDVRSAGLGDWMVELDAFLRRSDRQVVLLGNDRFYTYQNVYAARSRGVEGASSWLSPGRYLALDAALTWQDLRNVSDSGAFLEYAGDRLPNRPYLFSSWGARARLAGWPGAADSIEPFYTGRYVHSFFRGWESIGLREYKQVIPAQVTHAVGLTWTLDRYPTRGWATLEVDNLSDARVFDNFGVERPGRSLALKLALEL